MVRNKKYVPPERQKVPRTKAGGTWTKARYFAFIRSTLRSAFTRYPVKHQIKKEAARTKKGAKRYEYQCNVCKGWFPNSQVEVDHIVPAGRLSDYSDLPSFVERLFCEPGNLQCICKKCHANKTEAERKERVRG